MTVLERWKSSRRFAARVASTIPLPSAFSPTERGLLTVEEFLLLRNPDEKQHESSSYTFDLERLNVDHSAYPVGSVDLGRGRSLQVTKSGDRGLLLYLDERLTGVFSKGTLYHDPRFPFPFNGYFNLNLRKWEPVEVERTKLVKYVADYAGLVSRSARHYLDAYPYVLRRLILKGEPLEVRMAAKPTEDDAMGTVVILNSSAQIVAQGADEWGATLLGVAQEYRGRGLGKVLGRIWYQLNPNSKSGGFTPAGERNAIALWKDRVREFLANGWYSELVRSGRLSPEKVRAILKGLGSRREEKERAPDEKSVQPKNVLIMIDPGSFFYVYDEAFFDEPDERFIYAYGFFRDSGDKTFLYTIDYERRYRKLATLIALQMARDAGEDLYDGGGYNDVLELEGIAEAEKEGDYVRLTKDVLDLNRFMRLESAIRRKRDPYEESKHTLMELAETKDW